VEDLLTQTNWVSLRYNSFIAFVVAHDRTRRFLTFIAQAGIEGVSAWLHAFAVGMAIGNYCFHPFRSWPNIYPSETFSLTLSNPLI
jgi:hypothetical protein